MVTNDDVLTRARAVVAWLREAEGEATPGPWSGEESARGGKDHWYEVAPLGADGARDWTREVAGFVSEDGPFVVALRTAAPALLALAEATIDGHAAWEAGRRARYQGMTDADYAAAYARGQDAKARADAALADLAALDGAP